MSPIPLAFTYPFVLAALAGLPLLYFLLRITPPRPVLVPFPPLRLILGLRPASETARHTPWWLAAVASRHRGLSHIRDGGTCVESFGGGDASRTAADRFGQWLAGGTELGAKNFRGVPADRGCRPKFAARRRCRDIGGATRDPAPRCGQGARPFAGSQTRALSSRPAAGSGGDRKICRHASKAEYRLDRRRAGSRPSLRICWQAGEPLQ